MSTREMQEQLVECLKQWQKIENATITVTGGMLETTRHPVVTLLIELIQRDSQMHHRVQQMIIDSLLATVAAVAPGDLEEVWEKLESHMAMERESVRLAQQCLEMLRDQGMPEQELLLTYLHLEESKHERLLDMLAEARQRPAADAD